MAQDRAKEESRGGGRVSDQEYPLPDRTATYAFTGSGREGSGICYWDGEILESLPWNYVYFRRVNKGKKIRLPINKWQEHMKLMPPNAQENPETCT